MRKGYHHQGTRSRFNICTHQTFPVCLPAIRYKPSGGMLNHQALALSQKKGKITIHNGPAQTANQCQSRQKVSSNFLLVFFFSLLAGQQASSPDSPSRRMVPSHMEPTALLLQGVPRRPYYQVKVVNKRKMVSERDPSPLL